MTRFPAALALLAVACGAPQPYPPVASEATRPPAKEPSCATLNEYTSLVSSRGRDPKEYILGLFESHDVVILGERLHPELTQWDFIYELVTDLRFRQSVGRLYTEYGPVNLQARLDRYLANPDAGPADAIALQRDFGVWPTGWLNRNFLDFLERLRTFQQAHPGQPGVRLLFSDVYWDWSALNPDNYAAFFLQLASRDFVMARRIALDVVGAPGERRKALVIMNTPHSFAIPPGRTDAAVADTTGSHLSALLAPHGLRVASVLLNQTVVSGWEREEDDAPLPPPTLIADGRWDAAFRALGDRPVGVDLANSPFGRDRFDLSDEEQYRRLSYADVYTGLLFLGPLSAHRKQELVLGFFDAAFIAEVRRRVTIIVDGLAGLDQASTDSFHVKAVAYRRRMTRFGKLLDMVASPSPVLMLQLYREEPLYHGPRLAHIEAIVSRCLAAGRRDAVGRIRP